MGSEIQKTRPALIISNDINNLHAKTITILPLTSNIKKVYPFEVFLRAGTVGELTPAKVKTDQIRTVDKSRLGRLIGIASDEVIAEIESALRLHLGFKPT